MEDLIEANRVAEVSLSKLNSCRNGGLSLRRTLLVSSVLTKSQTVASSAYTCETPFTPVPSSERCTSKLLASFGHSPDKIDGVPVSSPRATLPGTVAPRPKSPSSLQPSARQDFKTDEESMDFENVSSVLNSVWSDTDFEDCGYVSDQLNVANDNLRTSSAEKSWFTIDAGVGPVPVCCRPVSPGKRNYHEAFPLVEVNCDSSKGYEESKRFKPSDDIKLEAVPGLCAFLSSKNLQTAPFITYMFGKGFSEPSNPSTCGDWPQVASSTSRDQCPSPKTFSLHPSTPILAF